MINDCPELMLIALISFEKPSAIVTIEVPEFRIVTFMVSPVGTFSTNRMFVIAASSALPIKPCVIPPDQRKIRVFLQREHRIQPLKKEPTYVSIVNQQQFSGIGFLIRLMNPKSTLKAMIILNSVLRLLEDQFPSIFSS